MNASPTRAHHWICCYLGFLVAAHNPQARGGERLFPAGSPVMNGISLPGAAPTLTGGLGTPRLAPPAARAYQAPPSLLAAPAAPAHATLTIVPGSSIAAISPSPLLTMPCAPPATRFETTLPMWQDGPNVNVTVYQGFFQVTLEVAAPEGWKPLDTVHLDGKAQTVAFALPEGVPFNTLRATGTTENKFTAAQASGDAFFAWQDDPQPPLLSPGPAYTGILLATSNIGILAPIPTLMRATAVTGGAVGATLNVSAFSANTNFMAASIGPVAATANTVAATTTASAPTPATTPAEAVESDIWKVIGNRLFFFNQYRGLQVFDLKDPSHPVKTGALRMAAVGEQFYALDDKGSNLALLAANNTRKHSTGSTIHLLSVSPQGTPADVVQLPLEGTIKDSRLLGTRLYVLLSTWNTDTSTGKVMLQGYELANPAAPVNLGSVDVPAGCYLSLQAAGSYLMIASSINGGWQDNHTGHWSYDSPNNLSVVSISGDGTPRLVKTVATTGYIYDQFAMDVDGGILSAVSQAWTGGQPNDWGWNGAVRQTWVETFALSGTSTAPLGRLKIDKADGEVLHATRFDSKRLYIVTFHVTDPLFIIDLHDPAHLSVTGQLETPGWSAFIYPQGNRLLAVGLENWRVCVSWFDVSDLSSPKMLSRVYPGDGNYSTWSDAPYDHKAVTWVKEDNKVFVPFQMYDYTNGGQTSATQVINLVNDTLQLGIAIENKGTARRGTVINGCLASISGKELVITTDPDVGDPEEIAWLELSWPVDRVVALDHYLLQVEDGTQNGWWGWSYTSTQEAVVRLADRSDPDTVLDSVGLGQGTIIGMTQRGSRMYIAQIVPPGLESAQLRTWALGIDRAGKIQKQSATAVSASSLCNGQLNTAATQALWPTAGTLVWHVPAQPQSWGYYYGGTINYAVALGTLTLASSLSNATLAGSTNLVLNSVQMRKPAYSGDLCAVEFPVDVGSAAGLTSGTAIEVNVPGDASYCSAGGAFADGGFVFFSAERCNRYQGIYPVGLSVNAVSENLVPNYPAYASSLHVLDFRHGLQPVVRDPASIAGLLLGLSSVDASGALLITGRAAGQYDDGSAKQKLASLAYDGVRAHLIDTLDVHAWTATASSSGQLYLALPTLASSAQANVLSIGLNVRSAQLEQRSTWQIDTPATSLKVLGSHLLASSSGDLEVADIGLRGTLQPRASLDLPTTMCLNVERAGFDPDALGLWLPAGDYGVQHFSFLK